MLITAMDRALFNFANRSRKAIMAASKIFNSSRSHRCESIALSACLNLVVLKARGKIA